MAFPEGITYLVKHAGNKYPVYDVQVRLQDLDRGPKLPDGSVNFAGRGWVELRPANFLEAQDQEPRRVTVPGSIPPLSR
jgi:hypothetical protein